MGDGNVPELRELATLAEGFPYFPPSPRGVLFTDMAGACDPLMRDQYQRENPTRYATVFWRFVRQAGGELLLSAQQLSVFQAGAGESGAGTGGTTTQTAQTRAETNAFNGGGVAKQQNKYIGVGFSVQPLAPFIVATDADAIGSNSTRRRPPWFSGGTDYGAECLRLLADSMTMLLLHGQDTACTYDLGPASMWITQSPVEGYKPVLGMPGQFSYLAIPDVSGNKQDGYNLQVNCTVNEGLRVDSDPLNPTVAGFDVVVPMRVALVGFPVCVGGGNGAAACAMPGQGVNVQAAVQVAVKQAMGELRDQFGAMIQQAMGAAAQGAPAQLGPGKGAGYWR